MQKFNGSLIRQFPSLVTGNAASGVNVTVYVSGANTLATLYATDSTSGATLSNPRTTDVMGNYAFYAVDGKYRLVFSDTRYTPLEVQCLDAVQVVSEIGMGQGLVGQAASSALQSITSQQAEVEEAYDEAIVIINEAAEGIPEALSLVGTGLTFNSDITTIPTGGLVAGNWATDLDTGDQFIWGFLGTTGYWWPMNPSYSTVSHQALPERNGASRHLSSDIDIGSGLSLASFLTAATPVVNRWVKNYSDIDLILTTTTGPVTIFVPVGRFKSPTPANLREAVYIIGSGMPDDTDDRLIGGTILEGKYHSYNYKRGGLINLGVDCGAATIAAGKASETDAIVISNYFKPDGTTAVGQRLTGWTILNVVGMCKTPTSPFHALLLEGLDPPCVLDNAGGIYANTPVVLKCGPIQVGRLRGVGGFFANVLLKSNAAYGVVTGTQVSQVLTQARGGYGAGTLIEADTADLIGVRIDQINADPGCDWVLRTSTTGSSKIRASVGCVTGRLIKGTAITIDSQSGGIDSFTIDRHQISEVGYVPLSGSYTGILVTSNAGVNKGVNIGSGYCDDCSGNGYGIDGYTIAGDINAQNNDQYAVYATANYEINKLHKSAGNASGVFGGVLPYTQSETILAPLAVSGGTAFDTSIRSFGLTRICFAGQVANPPVIPSLLTTLDARYRPLIECRLPVTCLTGSTFTTESLLIKTNGEVILEKTSAADAVILSSVNYSVI